LAVEHWVETQLEPAVETALLMPQPTFEADFWFVVNRKVLCIKSVMRFGICASQKALRK